jgi:hypothetical protein
VLPPTSPQIANYPPLSADGTYVTFHLCATTPAQKRLQGFFVPKERGLRMTAGRAGAQNDKGRGSLLAIVRTPALWDDEESLQFAENPQADGLAVRNNCRGSSAPKERGTQMTRGGY